jgi:ATP-dependent 26S proteasome regulatory subunit
MSASSWQQVNQHYLTTALAQIKQRLEQKVSQIEGKDAVEASPASPGGIAPLPDLATIAAQSSVPTALEQLCETFNLSTFEQDILLLCAGMELDSRFPALCALAQGDPQKNYPTFSLALSLLPDAHWSALTPNAPLRKWRLIELGSGTGLTLRSLRIDERILHYLAGVQHLDERLEGYVDLVPPATALVESHQQLVDQLATTWAKAANGSTLPVIQLCGEQAETKREIAQATCKQLELQLHRIDLSHLPVAPNELLQFLKLWEREAILSSSALLLDCDEVNLERYSETATRLIERIRSPLLITTRDRLRSCQRSILNLDVGKPSHNEQQLHWQIHLGPLTPLLNEQIDAIVAQFNLSSTAIQSVCTRLEGQINPAQADAASLKQQIWQICRVQARPQMDDLAQRIETNATWEDLILPTTQLETLRAIAAQIRQRVRVYQQWGFAHKSDRGLGISALFAGPSGTGKTTAAEILARELKLDLYRIDLSAVVSKYIGETEKNLRRVFDAAEGGGAVLLFDEADALFGKRSEVKDSHDRHANIEVSYLLQRMEAYQGLAILTTNLKGSLDSAFMRRIRFVLQFSFPDAKQRAEIWRRTFPLHTPTDGLDIEKLAKLNVAGGNIRNIALNAAFLAADENQAVTMRHVLSAARSEYAKLEKPITDNEIKGWV